MMKNINLKAMILFCILGFVFSCVCPPEKFVDFKAIKVFVDNPFVKLKDSLQFKVNFTDEIYLTKNKINFSLTNSAYATENCQKGWAGPKYFLTHISIKSDTDFKPDLPAGSELISIVKVFVSDSNGNVIYKNINEADISETGIGYNRYMWIIKRPDINKKHKLTIELEKSNGEVLKSTSEEIVWE
jgi:hypothetical protein